MRFAGIRERQAVADPQLQAREVDACLAVARDVQHDLLRGVNSTAGVRRRRLEVMADETQTHEVMAVNDLVLAATRERPFERLSEVEQIIVTIWWVEADVNNGGFDQYFFNSGGDMAWFAPTAFETIDAHEMAGIVKRANAAFGEGGPPRDRNERQERLLALPASAAALFNELDSEFYTYPDDVTERLHDFIARRASELLARVR